uniref:RING-type domain-containing protein n=2 Tax=Oryza TaxID=4527 RepID=A0A0E0QS77_ORYRU
MGRCVLGLLRPIIYWAGLPAHVATSGEPPTQNPATSQQPGGRGEERERGGVSKRHRRARPKTPATNLSSPPLRPPPAARAGGAASPPPSPPYLGGKRGPAVMTKSIRGKKCSSRQLRSHNRRLFSQCNFKRVANKELAATEKCAWKDSICPVCLECPHNAVLLLCSSHDKGCRPYICATNYHHSNCLDQLIDSRRSSKDCEDLDSIELTCPLCRGEVKGYTLVEPAREQLNQNKRSCMQDGCSYMGSYGELCKHVRKKHPSVKPHSVDPMEATFIPEFTARYDLCNEFTNGAEGFFEELMASVWHEGPHGAMQINEMNLADP